MTENMHEMWEGSYVIGDLHNIFNIEDTPSLKEPWVDQIISLGREGGVYAIENGERVAIFSIPPGAYTDSLGNDYIITSGLISVRAVKPLEEPTFTTKEGFIITKEENQLIIGDITISI